MAPPWEAIYTKDDMRHATFAQAKAFHSYSVSTYERLGYKLIELPKASAKERAAFISAHLGMGESRT